MPTQPKQSPFLQQAWLRKNDWWRYVLTLVILFFFDYSLDYFLEESLLLETKIIQQLTKLFQTAISMGVWGVLFYYFHRVSVLDLVSTKQGIRTDRIVLGGLISLLIVIVQMLVEILIFQPKFISFSISPGLLGTGLLAASIYALASFLGTMRGALYLAPGIFTAVRRPLAASGLYLLFTKVLIIAGS